MISNQHYTRNGFTWTFQNISEEVNHIIIRDNNLYPDSDSRSKRQNERIFPINDQEDLIKLKELFQLI